MKKSTRILLIAVTILVCLICLSNAVYIIIQGGGMAGLYGVNMERAQWNQEVLGLLSAPGFSFRKPTRFF